jgi:hypothetical protein
MRLVRLVVAISLAVIGWLWLIDDNEFSGPVVLSIGPGRGFHLFDALTLVPWALALWLIRSRRPDRPSA